MLAEVAGDGAVSRFRLHRLAVGSDEDGCHQSKGSVTLCHGVALHISVIVLTGPDESSVPFHRAGDHVVDEPVLIGDACGLELRLEFVLEDFLEDVLEASVVFFEDRILGAQVEWPYFLQRHVHATAGESADALFRVVHRHGHATAFELEDLMFDDLPVFTFEFHGELAFAGDDKVRCPVLVSESMSAHDDRTVPCRHQTGDVLDHDRLAEDRAVKYVADGAVGAFPHLLQVELLHAILVRSDGRAFDAYAILTDGMGGIDRHLVVRLVAVFHTKVVVLDVDIQVGKDELVLDEFPDDAGHLVAVQLHYGVGYFDLLCHCFVFCLGDCKNTGIAD